MLVAYRLLAPGSEWRLHREWFQRSAVADLLGEDAGLAEIQCGSSPACQRGRPAQPLMTEELRWLRFREESCRASDHEAVQRTPRRLTNGLANRICRY